MMIAKTESAPPAVETDIQIAQQIGSATLRALLDQEEWRSICGFRRDLVQGREDFGVSFHYLRIFESRKHRHHCAMEFCVGMQGKGTIVLEDFPTPIGKGDVVVVPAGTWHTYQSDSVDQLHLMIIVNPGIRPEVHDIEFWDEIE